MSRGREEGGRFCVLGPLEHGLAFPFASLIDLRDLLVWALDNRRSVCEGLDECSRYVL